MEKWIEGAKATWKRREDGTISGFFFYFGAVILFVVLFNVDVDVVCVSSMFLCAPLVHH